MGAKGGGKKSLKPSKVNLSKHIKQSFFGKPLKIDGKGGKSGGKEES